MALPLLHSEFPYIWGKFYFLFYQCVLNHSSSVKLQKSSRIIALSNVCSLSVSNAYRFPPNPSLLSWWSSNHRAPLTFPNSYKLYTKLVLHIIFTFFLLLILFFLVVYFFSRYKFNCLYIKNNNTYNRYKSCNIRNQWQQFTNTRNNFEKFIFYLCTDAVRT
jgi:hypothetical protein